MEKSKEHLDPPKNHTPRTSAMAPIRSRSLSRSRPTLGCGHGFEVPANRVRYPSLVRFAPQSWTNPVRGPSF